MNTASTTIHLSAPAKINIGLDVTGRRPNGYHEVCMIMQTIDLCDELTFTREAAAGIRLSTNTPEIPVGPDNLVCKAARLLMDEFQISDGLSIHLQKNIPVAAGMAGGSTDAAAVFKAMNLLFDLGLSQEELMERAVRIGADVPYCIMGGTALAEGIGEVLTPLKPMPKCPVLIAKPGIAVSTPFVYKELDRLTDPPHPDMKQLLLDMEHSDLASLASHMGNILEEVTIPAHPVIARIREQMLKDGAINAMMSGSGPTVFGLFAEEETARRACESMKSTGLARDVVLTVIGG